MDYSIQGTTNFMNKKIKLFNKADNFDLPDHCVALSQTQSLRCIFLHLKRRLLLINQGKGEELEQKLNVTIYKCALKNKIKIKHAIKGYYSNLRPKQIRYMELTLNLLNKYIYLYHYKDVIIALTLRKKLNGYEGVCRLIQSYI
jgi:hypothetical protein|tara:strand:- start:1208 stop:1639 length:432 start_codon:yes stop_codon:yes gene_type:complete